MRIRHILATVLGAFMLASLLPAGTASAYHPEEPYKRSYKLAVVPGSLHDSGRPLQWDEASFATLWCNPDGGDHPEPEQACDDIREAGSIKKIDQSEGIACPTIFAPVTAFARGSEHFKKTFPNMCVLNATKGAVFDF